MSKAEGFKNYLETNGAAVKLIEDKCYLTHLYDNDSLSEISTFLFHFEKKMLDSIDKTKRIETFKVTLDDTTFYFQL